MAAYASVISLKHTIDGLLNSSGVTSSREILEFAYNEATSLQQVLERSNERSRSRSSMERVDALEGQIRDFANKLEDFLEFHELKLEEEEIIIQEITFFSERVTKIEKEYIEELSRDDDDDDDDAAINIKSVSSTISGFGVEMVGHSGLFNKYRDYLIQSMRPDEMCIFAFLGEQGSGRTVPVGTIFEEAREGRSVQVFDCLAWVTVGASNQMSQILISIISQLLDDGINNDELLIYNTSELSKYLCKCLENRRYMIVLEDVDDVEVVNGLKSFLPDESNGSLVFLITRIKEVAELAQTYQGYALPPAYLEEIMWLVTRHLLLGDDHSIEMEVSGRKIIRNCGSSFISFAKTLLFLINSEGTVEQWSKIAEEKENPIFMVADEISELSRIKIELQKYNTEFAAYISDSLDASDFVEAVRTSMYPERFFSKMQVISIFGMAGIGKTNFVMNLLKDNSVFSHFDHHVWINLGINYKTEEILIDILAQIYPDVHKLHMKEDEELTRNLCVQVSKKRCLIVLDDLCSIDPLHHLKDIFPNIKGITLVTTRLAKVAKYGKDDVDFEMSLLDKEESWHLLCQKVFVGGSCPPELEKAGRRIAEKCDGLPLLILTVADQLLQVEISQEYWNNVASGTQKSIFMNAHNQISQALLPSYQSLLQYLKPCFLYIGVFREQFEIPISELSNLWISEGFLEANLSEMEEDFVTKCLSELLDRSLVMVQHKVCGSQFKTCRLHAVFWHLSNNQAMKNKLFHAMNNYGDCSIASMESQRRLCVRNNILLGLKYVQKSMEFNISAHSLLCVSQVQQYPVPLNFDLQLMRVMNAITIRLYEFPVEFVRLVHLKYLGLTFDGKLPTSMSDLWKLQYLIVKRYWNITSSQNSRALPIEIWGMKELKHLQIVGGCLPNHEYGAGLLKLSTLLNVNAKSCKEEVFKWTPNLKRLGIQIELAPVDEGDFFTCLNSIHHLDKLESFKCVVENPHIRSEVVTLPAPLSLFPQSLKKLSLSGLGYPWKDMGIIGKLKNLEVLKLKCYAFQGPIWEMDSSSPFMKLKCLLIEHTNLVHWKVISPITMNLERLHIKHCYKLQELPGALRIDLFKKIEIVDCSPFTVIWAEQMGQMVRACEVSVYDSWFANTTQE